MISTTTHYFCAPYHLAIGAPADKYKVGKLNKAIYGLKQATRAWHIKIGESRRKLNFMERTTDSCLLAHGER